VNEAALSFTVGDFWNDADGLVKFDEMVATDAVFQGAPLAATDAVFQGAPLAGLAVGSLTAPPSDQPWQLALNIDTDDGHTVDYYNNDFWQHATNLGGATADAHNSLTQDYKNPSVFTASGVKQILVVVHNEGSLLGWRRWRTISSHSSLQDYFTAANTCDGNDGTLSQAASVHVASETIDAEEGTLSPHEPLVMNKAGIDGPLTNADLWFNTCGSADQDCNRMTTARDTTFRDVGWGLGTAYHANGACWDGGYLKADAELHVSTTAWQHGLIGSDCTSNGNSCREITGGWIGGSSGLNYDYAIYVAV